MTAPGFYACDCDKYNPNCRCYPRESVVKPLGMIEGGNDRIVALERRVDALERHIHHVEVPNSHVGLPIYPDAPPTPAPTGDDERPTLPDDAFPGMTASAGDDAAVLAAMYGDFHLHPDSLLKETNPASFRAFCEVVRAYLPRLAAPPEARVVWFTGDEPYGRESIAWCPDCGTGLIRTQAVKPNHCPQCGYSWPDLPPLCPDCGVPQWTTGHYCVAKPDAALAAQEGRGS